MTIFRSRPPFFCEASAHWVKKMGGSANILVFQSRMRVVYPRDEQEREALTPLSNACAQYIRSSASLSRQGGSTGNGGWRRLPGLLLWSTERVHAGKISDHLLPDFRDRRLGPGCVGPGARHFLALCPAGPCGALDHRPRHYTAASAALPGVRADRRRRF